MVYLLVVRPRRHNDAVQAVALLRRDLTIGGHLGSYENLAGHCQFRRAIGG